MALNIKIPFAKKLTVIRQSTKGFYRDGFFVPGATERLSIQGSIQQLDQRERLLLPEGSRLKEAYTLFTDTKLSPGNEALQTRADAVLIDGEYFEVIGISDYSRHLNLTHYKYTVVRDNRNESRDDLHAKGAV